MAYQATYDPQFECAKDTARLVEARLSKEIAATVICERRGQDLGQPYFIVIRPYRFAPGMENRIMELKHTPGIPALSLVPDSILDR